MLWIVLETNPLSYLINNNVEELHMPISRRNFLQTTGLAASTVTLTPTKPISPNDRVQIGCIGFGIMGQGDMATEAGLPGVEIVAVADV